MIASNPRLPKLNGADCELANFVLGLSGVDTGSVAARALLAEIDGFPLARSCSSAPCASSSSPYRCGHRQGEDSDEHTRYISSSWSAQDWGRKFLATNGGCVYIDLDHLELCVPEVITAWDHTAAWHAMLRIARGAMDSANAKMPEGRSIRVMVNNSDGHGHSYGSHLNFLVTRQAWDNITQRKPHFLGALASFQVSSIIYTGQGKVGSENGAPPVAFQISQRADFFETLIGTQTTFNRPIINTREEHHCGTTRWSRDGTAPARLHVIFFDNTLAHQSCVLKVGVMQLMLSMMEAGVVNPALLLDDPLTALTAYSHDPTLQQRAVLAGGDEVTAIDLQFRFLEEARQFAAMGGFGGFVPRAEEIMDLWEDTLRRLRGGDWTGLADKLDWVMKRMILERALNQRPELDWNSPEIRHLDQIYSSLGPDGLYWAYEKAGFATRLVSEERIRHFCSDPPSDTRAWTRAMLLRSAQPGWVSSVDWDSISFRVRDGGYWPWRRTVDMENPLRLTAAETAEFFPADGRFADLLDTIEAAAEDPRIKPRNAATS